MNDNYILRYIENHRSNSISFSSKYRLKQHFDTFINYRYGICGFAKQFPEKATSKIILEWEYWNFKDSEYKTYKCTQIHGGTGKEYNYIFKAIKKPKDLIINFAPGCNIFINISEGEV